VAIAVLIQGISKSGFAGGAGILSLPLMMFVMPADKVTATLLLILNLCDFNAIYHHRENKDWQKIRQIFPACVVGIAIGGVAWWWMGKNGVEQYNPLIKRFCGAIALLFSVYIVAKEASMRWVAQHRAGPRTALVCGLTAGFTSTISHGAGPFVNLYLFSQGLGKTMFVGTVAWTFMLINLTKLPIYFGVGLITPKVILFDLMLVPLVPLGSWLGHWMHHRVPERPFNYLIAVLTFTAGAQLLFNVQPLGWLLEQAKP
jgi:uncharacterized membrane protein YfcA